MIVVANFIYSMKKLAKKLVQDSSIEGSAALRSALKLKNKEIEILHQISRTISEDLNLKDLLNEIIDLVTNVTRCDSCLLYLLDRNNEELILRASKNPHPKIIGRIKVKLGEGITGWVGKERHYFLLEGHFKLAQ